MQSTIVIPLRPNYTPVDTGNLCKTCIIERTLEFTTDHNGIRRFEPPKDYKKPFKWSEYINERKCVPVPAVLFTEQQHEGLCSSKDHLNTYFPSLFSKDDFATLSCKFRHNPRTIWHSLKQLRQEDMTEIYSKLGCFKILDEETQKKELLNTIPALALLPKEQNENKKAVNFDGDVKLEVSCLHRESVKLESATDTTSNLIITSLPHLLKSSQFIELTDSMRP